VTLYHACVSPDKPGLSGDPAVRLQALIGMKASTTGSICDDNYDATMRTLGTTLISSQSGNGCVPGTPPDEHDPRCEVDDLSEQADGSVHATRLPACLDGDGVTPCWRLVPFSACDSGLQVVVDRGSTPPPGAIRARCVVSR